MPEVPGASLEERKARVLIEKKTILNLVEAFSVAIKHYLRGEEGIYYEDLYHLVKFLPGYALPAGLPSAVDVSEMPKTVLRMELGTQVIAPKRAPKVNCRSLLLQNRDLPLGLPRVPQVMNPCCQPVILPSLPSSMSFHFPCWFAS